MNDPKLFRITDEDKVHYSDLIEQVEINKKDSIIELLGIKIQDMLDDGNLNSLETELINEMTRLVKILEENNTLSNLNTKKILFAMSYFIDEDDEIPDIIPNYGYLDDITIVSWIINDIEIKEPKE
ncbi:MAG: YkvA family protein [Candidatus Neomarinimicrobiota bacterium]|tara:strand:+ start:2163 stop:2540 length:378 start_codon:yes stop_codon:yes gene_type:complete